MSALTAVLLLLFGAVVWVLGVVLTQVITREINWWSPRLEALIARFAALIAPRRHDKARLRDTWLAELDFERTRGEPRVLMAMSFVVASVNMRRRSRDNGNIVTVTFTAANGAVGTDAAVVIDITASIDATGELTANIVNAGSTAAGVGGASASLSSGGLTAHGAARSGGSATLGFHSDVMERLATGDYVTRRVRYRR